MPTRPRGQKQTVQGFGRSLLRQTAHEALQAGHGPPDLRQQALRLAAALLTARAAAQRLRQYGVQRITCDTPDFVYWLGRSQMPCQCRFTASRLRSAHMCLESSSAE